MMRSDTRLLLRFGRIEDRQPGEAVLTDGDMVAAEPVERFTPGAAGHAVECACCVPRSGAARALAALFRRRAVGTEPAFQGVLAIVGPEGERAIRGAMLADVLVAARYRLV